ncbi:MAG: hypothetical protein EZS28_018048 [Streblomastix strix]|uniref:DDE-1 domain-containing protein n=1 Tax=Streblomastix strix TaxID=222440 RepID=A0A5J4VV74_9EUKA|nr:MAG: hypothetical protein EZS28_018048 [Streblomastix strix]
MKIKEEDILAYKQLIKKELNDIPVELIVSADEVGYSQYCDSRRRKIIVRRENKNKNLHNPVDRSERRLSILAGAAQSGDSLLPFVIIKKSLDKAAHLLAGIRHGVDAYLVEAEGTSMTNELFPEFLLNCAVPYFDKQRKVLRLNLSQAAALIVDNCSSHLSQYSRQICAMNNIKLLTMPPNSIQYLQVFDLGIFSSYKSHLQTLRRHNTHYKLETITRIALSALHQALAPINIQNSFKEAGYLREIRSNGRVYSTMNDAVFGDIIDAIEADKTLM